MKLSKITIPYRAASNLGFLLFILIFSGPTALSGLGFSQILIGLGVLMLAGGVIMLYHYFYWKNYVITVKNDGVEIEKGVFSRNHRDIPLRRIQNIDLNRNIVQRVLGISALTLETAGGNEVEASIKFLKLEDAQKLQSEIRKLKDRTAERQQNNERKQQGEQDFVLSIKNLSILSATSLNARAVGALFLILSIGGGVIGTGIELSGIGTMAVILMLFSGGILFVWASSFVANFVKFFDFQLELSENSLDYSRGMLNRASGSIPREKIQSLTVEENILKRLIGFSTLKVETAGYSAKDQLNQSETVIPISETGKVWDFAQTIQKQHKPEFQRIGERAKKRYARRYIIYSLFLTIVFYGLNQITSLTALYVVPLVIFLSSRKAAELKWKNIGYRLGEKHLVVRKGFWRRKTYIVPYFRVQNLIKSRTLFQRRWGQATVTVDTAGSVLTNPRIVDLEQGVAEEIKQKIFQKFRQSLR